LELECYQIEKGTVARGAETTHSETDLFNFEEQKNCNELNRRYKMTSVARLIVAIFLAIFLAIPTGVVSLPCNDPNAQVEHVCAKMKKVITSDGGDGLGDHYKRRVVSTELASKRTSQATSLFKFNFTVPVGTPSLSKGTLRSTIFHTTIVVESGHHTRPLYKPKARLSNEVLTFPTVRNVRGRVQLTDGHHF
jgi:hypothetical protein